MSSKHLLALLLSAIPGIHAAAAADQPVIDAVDKVVEPYVGRDAPGIAVLVMKNGEVLHMKGYGYANIDDETPIDENSIFDLASMSKNQTALAAMLLMNDEILSEDTEVQEILPEFKGQDDRYRPITVGDLIHHTAGLVDYLDGNETLNYTDDMLNEPVVAYIASQKLVRAPGTEYEYSNSAYVTLASVVAAADEVDSLRDVLQARVWDPLGMTSTNVSKLAEGVDPGQMVTGYRGTNGKFEENMEPTAIQGDGSIMTNLVDLAAYEKALATNELLDEESTDLLFTNGSFDNGKPLDDGEGEHAGYGYGWSLETIDGKWHYASHGGSWMGTATYYQRNLTSGVTVIVLANGEDNSSRSLAVDIENALPED